MTPLSKDEAKHRRIIQAAIQVFAEEGVSNGKIANIAKAAGIGKGTIYEYFSSKTDIFLAVFEYFFNKLLNGYEQLIREDLDPTRKIEKILDYTFDSLDEQLSNGSGPDWLIFLEIFLQGYRNEILGDGELLFSDTLRKMYTLFTPLLEEGIAAGVFKSLETKYAVFILFAALDGIGLHYFINRNHYQKELLKTTIKEIILHGLLKTDSRKV